MKKTVLNSLLAFVILSLLSFSALAAPTVLEYWTIFTGPDGQTMQPKFPEFITMRSGSSVHKFDVSCIF